MLKEKKLRNMLIIAQGTKLNIEKVLTHPPGPIPGTLANLNGPLQNKNNNSKSELKRILEKNSVPLESFQKLLAA